MSYTSRFYAALLVIVIVFILFKVGYHILILHGIGAEIMLFIVYYLGMCLCVLCWADAKDLRAGGWLLLAIFFTPLFAILGLIAVSEVEKDRRINGTKLSK